MKFPSKSHLIILPIIHAVIIDLRKYFKNRHHFISRRTKPFRPMASLRLSEPTKSLNGLRLPVIRIVTQLVIVSGASIVCLKLKTLPSLLTSWKVVLVSINFIEVISIVWIDALQVKVGMSVIYYG